MADKAILGLVPMAREGIELADMDDGNGYALFNQEIRPLIIRSIVDPLLE